MSIDIKKLREKAFEYLDCVTAKKLISDLLECGLKLEPINYGYWEEFDCDYGGIPDVGYYCSECGHAEMAKYLYCNCGAKMENFDERIYKRNKAD